VNPDILKERLRMLALLKLSDPALYGPHLFMAWRKVEPFCSLHLDQKIKSFV
jgi:hypothetical protein